ncbi:MORN motif [Sesbania bispinosa]|nr:MORN motif [Sesbania bispinosa]
MRVIGLMASMMDGVETWAKGSRYRGQYRKGLRHGIGIYRFYGEDMYTGEWSNSQCHGFGVHTCNDESLGEFKWGVKHGLGQYHFSGMDVIFVGIAHSAHVISLLCPLSPSVRGIPTLHSGFFIFSVTIWCQAKLEKLRMELLTPTSKGAGGAGEGFDVTKMRIQELVLWVSLQLANLLC